MPLLLSVGQSSQIGERSRNEDYAAYSEPQGIDRSIRGIVFALADGVGGSDAGREAAETTVRNLMSDYYATPETWGVLAALDKLLIAINRWMLAQSTSYFKRHGMATTLSVLILRGNRYYIGHIGDTRIYRLRGEKFEQLTIDHVWDHPERHNILKRAIGLDQHLIMDYADDILEAGDLFLLVSDGVWEPLGDKTMHELLLLYRKFPQQAAEMLVETALRKGSQDNATAQVVRVDQASDDLLHDIQTEAINLPAPPRLKPGQTIDDFEIVRLLHEAHATLLYQVRQISSQQMMVLKTLHPNIQKDLQYREGLLGEEWLAKRVVSHYFPQVMPLTSEQRHFLYYVMSYHEGATLQDRLDHGHHFSVAETVRLGIRLVKGLAALHRLHILHRDIKPDNLHLEKDGKLRILDLGVAHSIGMVESRLPAQAGTPSFIAPEIFDGEAASVQSDIYSVGVTLYYLLTRRYPYGEIEPFQHPHFGNPIPPTRYRTDIPQWLEAVLLMVLDKDPARRFSSSEELLLALEKGEGQHYLKFSPSNKRRYSASLLWMIIAVLSIVMNVLLIYLLLP